MCDFFLRDVSNEDGDGRNNAENSDTENSGNESDNTDAMDMENVVPESSTNEATTLTSTKSYRLRQSTKMKKIVRSVRARSARISIIYLKKYEYHSLISLYSRVLRMSLV